MTAVVGVDPAKRTHAMAVLDQHEQQLAALHVTNDSAGYRAMLALAKRWGTAPREYSSGGMDKHRRPAPATASSTTRCTSSPCPTSARTSAAVSTTPRARRRQRQEGRAALLQAAAVRRRVPHPRRRPRTPSGGGPGRQSGASTRSCPTDRSPTVSTSEKPLAGPAASDATPAEPALSAASRHRGEPLLRAGLSSPVSASVCPDFYLRRRVRRWASPCRRGRSGRSGPTSRR